MTQLQAVACERWVKAEKQNTQVVSAAVHVSSCGSLMTQMGVHRK